MYKHETIIFQSLEPLLLQAPPVASFQSGRGGAKGEGFRVQGLGFRGLGFRVYLNLPKPTFL